jgi:HlyD family secretion protein
MAMSKKSKRITVSLMGLVVLAAASFFVVQKIPSKFPSFLSKTVAAEDMLEIAPKMVTFTVDATGTLRATSVQNFGGPAAFDNYWQFQIVSMTPEGKNVKKGDPLIGFDAQKVVMDLQRYQNELDQANKELEKTKVQIDLEQQEINSRLAMAENNFEKLKLKQGMNTEVESSRNIELDKLALEQARMEYEALKDRMNWHKKSSEATFNVIASKKARAENKVNNIRRGMENFQAKADRDGVVIYKTRWNGEKFQVGENVWSGMPIMEIPDLSTIVAEALVPEVDVGKIKVGQTAEISIDAFQGKTYTGKIQSIGTLVRPKAWDIPNKILEVRVLLDQLDTSIMRPAMSIKARILTGSVSDCIAVPIKAIHTTADGSMVKVKTETGWLEQKVKPGDSNGTEIIITEGLKAGDRIAADFIKAK